MHLTIILDNLYSKVSLALSFIIFGPLVTLLLDLIVKEWSRIWHINMEIQKWKFKNQKSQSLNSFTNCRPLIIVAHFGT